MWFVDKILDLVLEAVKVQVIEPLADRRKIENRVKAATTEALEPLVAYLDHEMIPRDKQERLFEACIVTLRPLTEDPQKLFQASLDGEKIFEQLFPRERRPKNLPQVIRDDGMESIFSMLVPVVADLLCKVPALIKNYEPTRDKEIFKRFDELPDEIRQIIENAIQEQQQKTPEPEQNHLLLSTLPQRAEQFTGWERIRQKIDRVQEINDIFEILDNNTGKHILRICADQGIGKSDLLVMLFEDYRTNNINHKCIVDFEHVRSVEYTLQRIRDYIGIDFFPKYNQVWGQYTSPLETYEMRSTSFSAMGINSRGNPAQNMIADLTNALLTDIRVMGRVLLIFDSYNKATDEVKKWLIGLLLPGIHNSSNIFAIVAGQDIPTASDWDCFYMKLKPIDIRCWQEYANLIGLRNFRLKYIKNLWIKCGGNSLQIASFLSVFTVSES